jgi:hypothetical protein
LQWVLLGMDDGPVALHFLRSCDNHEHAEPL